MSSQGRNAGAAFCIVMAMLSMIAAVVLAAVAMSDSSKVSDKPLDEYAGELTLFEDADCNPKQEGTPPDQLFQKCYFEHADQTQRDAALWSREVASRQSSIQTKGYLAIVLGLFGVTFAVCAAIPAGGRREAPAPTPA
ncbi:hypothetical protein OHR86_26470 [Streptomyces sp. NBC_00441]|uniref:hypothetical protein n=1 Tax=Streptomyces sp. NBC_00441 TaxID=2975742 RepID=UPI002E2B3F88|nr:hypothetical protein [Streptomyces sp. NBC_00441]